MIILAIETSCDETAVAILEEKNGALSILSNIVSSQIELHAQWGGVVPNLAAREHLKNIIPVFNSALKEADKKATDIDLIAVTQGPGLIPALLIGTNFAKTIAYIYQKPLIGIHHIEGHIYANFITDGISVNSKLQNTKYKIQNTTPKFPILSLVVSGGHTQLILMEDHFKYQIIGETQDDAAGEAFDKVARILNLGYPGGPVITDAANAYAKKNKSAKNTDKELPQKNNKKYTLPRPMLHSKDFNFSFSGLKTAVLYTVQNYRKENNLEKEESLPKDFVQEIAYEFQEAATDVLVQKTIQAATKYNPQTIFLAGGVSANSKLRDKLKFKLKNNLPKIKYILQSPKYSTDNAAMIAMAAAYRWHKMSASKKKSLLNNWKNLEADSQLKI